jgi:hypothetical protein
LDEPVACDAKGRPTIVRQGFRCRTTVFLDDGTKRSFGKSTMQSLLASPQADTVRWLESLSDVELHGLVHEIGQQLVESSHLYRFNESQLECNSVKDGRGYFGLTDTSTLKDLDNAYKKMAKRMHPDKNGGTDHATRQFQLLRERYTALKKNWGKNETEGIPKEPRKEEAEQGGCMFYDPSSRSSMSETALEILRKIRTIQRSTPNMQPQKAPMVRVVTRKSCSN